MYKCKSVVINFSKSSVKAVFCIWMWLKYLIFALYTLLSPYTLYYSQYTIIYLILFSIYYYMPHTDSHHILYTILNILLYASYRFSPYTLYYSQYTIIFLIQILTIYFILFSIYYDMPHTDSHHILYTILNILWYASYRFLRLCKRDTIFITHVSYLK
jgi:hypothetical protein